MELQDKGHSSYAHLGRHACLIKQPTPTALRKGWPAHVNLYLRDRERRRECWKLNYGLSENVAFCSETDWCWA
jgi:hypothetical protein